MKKFFGKRGLALLTTLALLVSMVAMLSMTSSAEAYTPKRTISLVVTNGDINSKMTIVKSGTYVGEGNAVTVRGYYKLEGFTPVDESKNPNVSIAGTKIYADTDGYVYFEKAFTAGDASSCWQAFSFWYATGTLTLADVEIVDADGKVVYDLATDADLAEGSYTNTPLYVGMWYASHYTAKGNATFIVDPLYTAPSTPAYTPSRVISFKTSAGIQQSCFMLENACDVAAGKTITVKGYYKIDSFTKSTDGGHFGIFNVKATDVTDGWVAFAESYTVPTSTEWKSFGFWEAYGEFALADIAFVDANGNVLYDMATDASLIEGTYEFNDTNKYQKQGIWYLLACYGTVEAGSTCTVKIGAVSETPAVPDEYIPSRVITFKTSAGVQQSCMMLENACDVAGGKTVIIHGYYKVDSIDGTRFEAPGVVAPAVTDGWVEFSTTYDVPTTAQWKSFGFWEASGEFALADITFTDVETDEVLYDMTTDDKLIEGTYEFNASNKYQKQGIWYVMGCYGTVAADGTCTVTIGAALEPEDPCANGHKYENGACINCGTAKPTYPTIEGDTSYEPKRVMTVTGKEGAIEAKILIIGSGTQFGKGKIVVVKGMYKIENYDEAQTGNNHNVQIGICNNATGGVEVQGNTNGWVSFEVRYLTSDDAWLKFGHWYTYGTLSLADVVVEDTNGNVLYEMATDEALTPGEFGPEYTEDSSMWLPKYGEKYGMWYLGYYAGGDAKESASGTIGPVYVPEVQDPCADGHTFENGACVNCGEADPDYVEPPVQTGDFDMIIIAAMGMIAVVACAALTLNKKKFSV